MKPSIIRPLAVAVLLLVVAGFLNATLLRSRAALRGETAELRDAPPALVVSTIVLGGFRGVVADMLWLRASLLQQEGRYLELIQLAEWITTLEPRSSEVWAFHAWNLAYNVSIMMPEPAERWHWVDEAVRLLREDGLALNAEDPRLYVELGWILQHKIGGDSDRMHAFYQARLAERVEPLLPGGRADYEALAADPQRGQALRETLGFDWRYLQIIDAVYGPLDWRDARAHAVYWAYVGLEQAGPNGFLPCSRMLYQNLARLALEHRSPRLLRSARRAFQGTINRYNESSVRTAYAYFLARAVAVLRETGNEDQARVFDADLQAEMALQRLPEDFAARPPGPDAP